MVWYTWAYIINLCPQLINKEPLQRKYERKLFCEEAALSIIYSSLAFKHHL